MWTYLFAVLVPALVLAGYVWFCSWRVNREHRRMAESLAAAAPREPAEAIEPLRCDTLPAPARRYLSRAIPAGRRRVSRVRFTQTGLFRTREEPPRWQPFRAVQHVVTSPPGFVWDATVRMAPLLPARVIDSYCDGAGMLRARLLGVLTVADASGPETDSGEMMRYLAEAIWYPTALAPHERLRWEEVDEHSARAVLSDHGREVSVTFHFDEEGLVAYCEAERFRVEKGRTRKLPWRAYCGAYAVRDGFRIPLEARVTWILPSGEMEYFRGRVESIEYDP